MFTQAMRHILFEITDISRDVSLNMKSESGVTFNTTIAYKIGDALKSLSTDCFRNLFFAAFFRNN